MATPSAHVTLTDLVPNNYLFVYAVPLLVTSLLITFAGAFLTLDRTCTFAPQASASSSLPGGFGKTTVSPRGNRWYGLEGGVGGLAGGWSFGMHLSTFLSLIIINRTKDAPLSPVQFLVIYLASSIFFVLLAGRFKIVALACMGLAGGVGLALIISVMLHPTLLTRLIFVAILTPLVLVATVLPIVRTQHCGLRIAASSQGAFGIVVAIALLSHIPAWANVWERLWTRVSLQNQWGTGAERGLSAAACLFVACGIASDWFLRRQFGENPDQKWDSFLVQYAASLPNSADRAGTFQPPRSLWQRLLHRADPLNFPPDVDTKPKHSPGTSSRDNILLKPLHKRSAVKFKPLGEYSDSGTDDDSDSEPDWDSKGAAAAALSPPERPWLKKKSATPKSPSDTTVYSSDDESSPDKKRTTATTTAKAVEYSDSEGEDVATPGSTPLSRRKSGASSSHKSHRDEPGWKPDFLKRLTSDAPSPSSSPSVTAVSHTPPPAPHPPSGAVPMTPSLIRAIDRISVAQNDAYGNTPLPPPLSPPPQTNAPAAAPDKWQGFWNRVQHKARQGT